MKIKPPVAAVKEHWRTIHDDRIADPYYWMYDYFGKGPDSDLAVEYLKQENAYLDSVMEPTMKMQEDLFQEMKARIKEQDETPPVFKNGYYYYTRTEEGKQYYKYCRKKNLQDAPEEILLDVDALAEGHDYYSARGFSISEDNRFLAYGVDTVSRRQYSIHIKNLETGELFSDMIENTSGDPCWAGDHATLFYTSKNPVTLLSEKICKHRLGTPATADPVVYEETDKSNYIGVYKSKNRSRIFIVSKSTTSSEYRMIGASNPETEFRVFQPRMENTLYDVIPLADRFLIRTNKDGATNFKLMECPLDLTGVSSWVERIPVRPDVLLQDVTEFHDYIVLSERKEGLAHLSVIRLSDQTLSEIDFGESAYYADLGSNPEYNSNTLRYIYSSLTSPFSTYDYDLLTGKKMLVKQAEVLGGYDMNDYQAERLYAPAEDGTRIPVSVVFKKGYQRNGNSPLLLYGYGSYGHSMEATFSSTRLSLLNRGFAFAIAHVRGGQEMGRQWYEDGKMMKKKNSFTDFIDCAKYLIREKYTSSPHLYAMGGSAGGLLMGAVINMAPELWHGVIAQVPFVDVVNTMLDESIPLTTNEFDEWGNPKEKEAYLYMKSYSPYENIKRTAYPHLLVRTGLHDSQVQYFEPAKWVAKLRTLKTDENLLILHTNMEFGHGGASGRFDYLKDVALEYAFLFYLEKI